MQVGDVVKHCFSEKIGIVMKEIWHPLCGITSSNKVFDILWQNGTIGHNVWNHDLEVIRESR